MNEIEEKIKNLAIKAKKVNGEILEKWDNSEGEEFNCDIAIIEEAVRELNSVVSVISHIPLQ